MFTLNVGPTTNNKKHLSQPTLKSVGGGDYHKEKSQVRKPHPSSTPAPHTLARVEVREWFCQLSREFDMNGKCQRAVIA